MPLTPSQSSAVRAAITWYFNKSSEQNIFVISGAAGTGKSSVANVIVNLLGLMKYQVLYVAPTGKAAGVLRMKGCVANTVHKTFYTIRKSQDDKILFNKKKAMPQVIKLIVMDELSMVNDKMMDDVLSFGIPILGLGDFAQLPPIYGANRFVSNPDVVLTDVVRQQGDSGILKLATMARLGQYIKPGKYNESTVTTFSKIDDITKYDVVLCWKNETRRELNRLIRNKLGYTSTYPMKREKLMCLKNNYTHMLEYDNDIPILLVNGMSCVSLAEYKELDESYLELNYRPDYVGDLYNFKTRCSKDIFLSYNSKAYLMDDYSGDPDDVVYMDYGYAYTVSKSQGSEWKDVLIMDEFGGGKELYRHWLYTALTRGKRSVTLAYT